MSTQRWLNPQLPQALKEGEVWERITKSERHESAITLLRSLEGTRGRRWLVEGLDSGRQWTISHPTLLDTYQPKPRG